jgi:hypothetical protein
MKRYKWSPVTVILCVFVAVIVLLCVVDVIKNKVNDQSSTDLTSSIILGHWEFEGCAINLLVDSKRNVASLLVNRIQECVATETELIRYLEHRIGCFTEAAKNEGQEIWKGEGRYTFKIRGDPYRTLLKTRENIIVGVEFARVRGVVSTPLEEGMTQNLFIHLEGKKGEMFMYPPCHTNSAHPKQDK